MKAPKRIALLGFDCTMTSLVQKHIDEGLCPNFKRIFEQGTVADNCLVPFPTITPPNWTVMATGAWPGTNGVTDFLRHVPGATPDGFHSHNCFNWDHVQAESIWEAAERAGKRSIIFNYPVSHNVHKKLRHATVVGGSGLNTATYWDGDYVAQKKKFDFVCANISPQYSSFCDEVLVTNNAALTGDTSVVNFVPARGWTHVTTGPRDMEAEVRMTYPFSMFDAAPATWRLLVRHSGTGYDKVTLGPDKDMEHAFFTIGAGEWSPACDVPGMLADGGVKTCRMMARQFALNDNLEDFRLYLSHAVNRDGELWCYPPDQAGALTSYAASAPMGGMGSDGLMNGWYGLDVWSEIMSIHMDWAGSACETLLEKGDWDIFYSHSHPTDLIYHLVMRELDPVTSSGPEAHARAWEIHRQLYRDVDRYLGRLLKLCDDGETLIALVGDHGATTHGPAVDMVGLLTQAGLCKEATRHSREYEASVRLARELPAALRDYNGVLSLEMDAAQSRAMPQRSCFVNVNLKGRDPQGIVEPEDYENTQREIMEALMSYVHPATGKKPFCLAVTKREAMLLGLWGDQCGDVVYAVWPEYSHQHGCILPTAEYGIGSLKTMCVYYGPQMGIRQGYHMQRVCNIVDLVPTFCYLTGWPLPRQAEGAVVYQIMEDPDWGTSGRREN